VGLDHLLAAGLLGVPLKSATANSTFMIGMTGVASAAIQLTRGMIDPVLAAPVILGIFAGATLAPRVATRISTSMLRMLFLIAVVLSFGQMGLKTAGR
jgi:uncharacterized membrane protein YfcA